jgi:PAS domain S-box-containing protein
MTDFCYAPGLSAQEVEGILRSLSLHEAEDVPVLAIVPPVQQVGEIRVLFASRSMLSLLGVADLEALSARLFKGGDPGARRLVELSTSLAQDGGPRLERLRFFLGPAAQTFTFLCRKVTRPTGNEPASPIFVATALGVRAPLLRAAPNAGLPVSAPQVLEPVAAPPRILTIDEVRDVLKPRFGSARTVRFLWRTDADGKITEITPPLAEVVGAAAADLLGRDFGDVAKYLHLDADGRLAEAFAKRETWSGVEVLWPIAGAAVAVPVGLGGLPAFDRDGRFDGYRGFGVIQLEKLVAAEPHQLGIATSTPAVLAVAPPVPIMKANVVQLRPLTLVPKLAAETPAVETPPPAPESQADRTRSDRSLSSDEQKAFEEIAVTLKADEAVDLPLVEESPEKSAKNAAPEAIEERAKEVEKPQEPTLEQEPAKDISVPAETTPALVSHELPEAAPESMPALPVAPIETPATVGDARAAWLAQNGLGTNAIAILDRLGQGLLVSRDDVPIYVNRTMLDLLGYADEDAFHASGGMANMFEQVPANGGEPVSVRTAAGEIIGVQARLQSVEWDHLPATLLTLRRDEEREARAKLEATLRKRDNDVRELNAILDTATDGLAIVDVQGRILALNRSGEALFGCDHGEVVGQPLFTLLAPESQAKARDYFDGLKTNGVASLLNDGREVVGRPRRGGAIPIFMTLGRVGSGREDQPEQKFCALLRDMTHWKKVEQELQDARKEAERASALKSDFLAKVSHEIRTPLNAIMGFAEVIVEERFGPIGNERYRDYLKDIHSSGVHVMSLVNDLLDLSKIEAGKMELAIASVDANRIISECVSIMQPQANRERVIMRLALAPHLPQVMADERSLRQIILNLLSNAVKFNEPGGQVIISSAVTDAGQAVIRIRDTGIGMSEQDIETALEPFRQLATSRPTTGTGLGLPLTKALVEANRAFFTIKSKKNEGTLVEVAFPQTRVVAA